jgi:hypothetical protein
MMTYSLVSCRIRSLGISLVVALFVLVPNVAIAADNCGSVDRLIVALRLTRILYPELKEKEVSMSFSVGHGSPLDTPTDAADLGIAIDKPLWHPQGQASEGNDISRELAIDLPLLSESLMRRNFPS